MAPRRCGSSVDSYSEGFGRCGSHAFVSLLNRPMASRRAPAHARGPAELSSELAEQALLRVDVATCPGDLMPKNLAEREVLKQRHDVGECLVKGEHVGIGRTIEAAVHAVEQGVRGFVGDDVVRQAGEHHAAGHVVTGIIGRRGEIPEEKRLLRRAEIGVRLAQGMWIDSQPSDEVRVVGRIVRVE